MRISLPADGQVWGEDGVPCEYCGSWSHTTGKCPYSRLNRKRFTDKETDDDDA